MFLARRFKEFFTIIKKNLKIYMCDNNNFLLLQKYTVSMSQKDLWISSQFLYNICFDLDLSF